MNAMTLTYKLSSNFFESYKNNTWDLTTFDSWFSQHELIKQFQEFYLKYTFENISLLRLALCHPSFLNEFLFFSESYQRIEFLGDSILSAWVSEWLFVNNPKMLEGKLSIQRSYLVRKEFLNLLSQKLHIKEVALVGKGLLDFDNFTESMSCDFFESILGAMFLDSSNNYKRTMIVKKNILNLINTNKGEALC